ncbi:MAG: response regulator transcription factor, partial [Acidobacteriota bacterium]
MTRVLIADDNAIFREVLKRHVTSLFDFAVTEAQNGLEAVEKAEAEHPDMVLLDLAMP